MRVPPLFFIIWIAPAMVMSQDSCHFRPVDIPLNERRMSELAGVQEFRCGYELAGSAQRVFLIAELFREGKCAGRFRLSHIKNDEPKTIKSGTISIGWHRDTDNLVSVLDNGETCWPSKSIHLEYFSPVDAYYFSNSLPETQKPEKRSPEYKGCELYPVIGLCGRRSLKIDYPKGADTQSFLQACSKSGAKEAVVIYLYVCGSEDEPPLKYSDQAH